MKTMLFASMCFVLVTHATAAGPSWPVVTVEKTEPLFQNARFIRDTFEKSGNPMLEAAQAKLEASAEGTQQALDPLSVGAVLVQADGAIEFIPAPSPPPLLEQGWRPFLVKIVNPSGLTGTLRADSPNARPVPNSPKEEGERRWLDLDFNTRTPFSPNLGGQPLEYRVLTLWAREAGPHTATFSFNLGRGAAAKDSPATVQRWDFEKDAGGWQAQNQCALEVRDGALQITSTGNDPFMGTAVKMPAGDKLVRFRAKNAGTPAWQFFWATEKRPQTDGRHARDLTVFQDLGQWSEYSINFRTEDPLAAIRIDPGTGEGKSAIDWIEIISLDDPAAKAVTADVALQVEPSQEVKFAVRDENGQPCTAAFTIRDERGRVYPLPSKRLAPDFFFQQQIYRGDGESVQLPGGIFTVVCTRGPESLPETKKLIVAGRGSAGNDGAHAPVIDYQVKRWIDPSKSGWFSGDHHIHAAGCQHYTNPTEGVFPPDMQRHIMGEDLKVGCNLTWGPCFDFQKQFFTGRIDKVSQYPYLLRYDIEVSGFGSHQSGHLCLLRLKEQIFPGGDSDHHWPTLGLNTLKWAKRQGAITGPAHSGNGLAGNAGRVDGPDGPNGLPNYTIPNYDGIGANEYVVDITHDVPGEDGKPVPAVDFISTMDTNRIAEINMWYHGLNCGFRVRASGETDFPCITGERVGGGRVYVKQDGKLDFDAWCEGIRDGRSYVSDGTAHLMDFTAGGVAVGEKGSQFKLAQPGNVKVAARVVVRHEREKEVLLEVVVNGYPVAKQMIPGDGSAHDVAFDVKIDRSSWVALRMFPSAHTNPVFVLVADKPIRASRRSAEWLRLGVDQCWKSKERTYLDAEKDDARTAYAHAREIYDHIIAESDVD